MSLLWVITKRFRRKTMHPVSMVAVRNVSNLSTLRSLLKNKRPNTYTGYWKDNLQNCLMRHHVKKVLQVRHYYNCLKQDLTIPYIAWGLPRPAAQRVNSFFTNISLLTATSLTFHLIHLNLGTK